MDGAHNLDRTGGDAQKTKQCKDAKDGANLQARVVATSHAHSDGHPQISEEDHKLAMAIANNVGRETQRDESTSEEEASFFRDHLIRCKKALKMDGWHLDPEEYVDAAIGVIIFNRCASEEIWVNHIQRIQHGRYEKASKKVILEYVIREDRVGVQTLDVVTWKHFMSAWPSA